MTLWWLLDIIQNMLTQHSELKIYLNHLYFNKAPLPQDVDEFETSDRFPTNTQQWLPLIASVHQS